MCHCVNEIKPFNLFYCFFIRSEIFPLWCEIIISRVRTCDSDEPQKYYFLFAWEMTLIENYFEKRNMKVVIKKINKMSRVWSHYRHLFLLLIHFWCWIYPSHNIPHSSYRQRKFGSKARNFAIVRASLTMKNRQIERIHYSNDKFV